MDPSNNTGLEHLMHLPIEIRRNILLDADIRDITALCSSDLYRSICTDEVFWKMRLGIDYPNANDLVGQNRGHPYPYYRTYMWIYTRSLRMVDYLISEYCIVDPEYLNMEPLRRDVFKTLIEFIDEAMVEMKVTDGLIDDYDYDLLGVVSGIKSDYYESYSSSGKYDPFTMQLHSQLHIDLTRFMMDDFGIPYEE